MFVATSYFLGLRVNTYAATPTTTIAATIPPMTKGLVRSPTPKDEEVTVSGMVSTCDNEPIVAFRVIV